MGGSNFWTNSNQRASENAVLVGLPTAKSGSTRWRRGHGCLAHQAPRMVDVVSLGGLCGLKRDTDSELPLGRGAHEIPPVQPVPVVSRRARMYTSGGFSPDGITAMTPDSYSRYFRLHAQVENETTGNSPGTMTLDEANVEYSIPLADGTTGKLKILGLADLGLVNSTQVTYNTCYFSDNDNYIDICLTGSEDAARRIVALEMPAGNNTADPQGTYLPLYNPGGPGPTPAPGVNYTNPSPYLYQPVMMALDDPFTVTVYDTAEAIGTTGGNAMDTTTTSAAQVCTLCTVVSHLVTLVTVVTFAG